MSKKTTHTIKYTGRFISNRRGYGFVEVDGLEDDIYVPADKIGTAFHMDEVEVEIIRQRSGNHRSEGRIICVISHGMTEIVGTYDDAGNFGFVVPDLSKISNDIFIAGNNSMGARGGQKVVAKITDYGDRRHKPEGEIVEIIGDADDPGVDVLSIVKGYGLPESFPENVSKLAKTLDHPVTKEQINGRRDLRDLLMVTIDGEDSKDLDDAVSLYKEGDIYHLGVHIADVSDYVTEGSALDEEAQKRGTSVYLADRVIPMLPYELCNGICSLNMGEERLALSCLVDIDKEGKVIDHEITESVIKVDERMNYSDVNEILYSLHNTDESDEEDDKPVGGLLKLIKKGLHKSTRNETDLTRRYKKELPMFLLMEELADILRETRKKRGSIDFDIPESKITVDKKGRPVKIQAYDRGVSQRIIEEFMLMANETVAEHFYWMESPFVYRVHGAPDPDKIFKLGEFINNFGYSINLRGRNNSDVHPRQIQTLLSRIEGTDEEALISRLTLRSMQRARYSTANEGHFGLAAEYYCHFTSPIRRYPDLQIHRIIKEQLHGSLDRERMLHYEGILPTVALKSSDLERRANDAERDVEKLKKTEYMIGHIGETFEGVISGITDWGIYVELQSTVEGMVHVNTLEDDRYFYDESTYEMKGLNSGRTFKLGQRVKVYVYDADIQTRTIDFRIVTDDR